MCLLFNSGHCGQKFVFMGWCHTECPSISQFSSVSCCIDSKLANVYFQWGDFWGSFMIFKEMKEQMEEVGGHFGTFLANWATHTVNLVLFENHS